MAKVEDALAMIEGRWKLAILDQLFSAPQMRFSELWRAIPEVTQTVLARQLRDLQRQGIIDRTIFADVPPRVEYRLTETGRALQPSLEALLAWAEQKGAAASDNARQDSTTGHDAGLNVE